jgi:hypothetical protein
MHFGVRLRYTGGQCGPSHKRKIPHIIRRKVVKKSQQVETSPVRRVPFAQATNRPKCTPPSYISLVLPFVSCHGFSSTLFSFATQCRVQSQVRPDPLPPQYFARILVDVRVCPPFSSCPSAGCNRQLSLTIWLESCERAIGCTNLPLCSATRQAATTNPNNTTNCYSSQNKVYWNE